MALFENYEARIAQINAALNANGIKAYLFSSLRPTPELSFAIRTLKSSSEAPRA